tara:strand:+ start:2088 stop:3995 length:1908 start_codon:yes stop_codon:yes gene_type:complete
MATNFHSDLPNDQIHSPKDFSTSNNSSVLTKGDSGLLDWNTSPYGTECVITCGGDVAGGLHNKAFYVYADGGVNSKAECHFGVTGDTTPFIPTAGYFQITIPISANDDAIAVAFEIHDEFGKQGGVFGALTTSLDGQGKFTISGMTNGPDTLDKDTGFGFRNTQTFTGVTVLTSTSGVLSWETAGTGGGGAVSSVSAGISATSSGSAITISPITGTVSVRSNAYNGTSNVGHVPAGGDATTYLRGDGTWDSPAVTGTTYQEGNGIGIDTSTTPDTIAVDSSVIRNVGNQNIAGSKTFTGACFGSAPGTSDASNRLITSQWVNNQNYGTGTVTSVTVGGGLTGGTITGVGTINLDSTVLRTTGNQTIAGDKDFTGNLTAITQAAATNDAKVATTEFVTSAVATAGVGTAVTAVTANKPANSSGGLTPVISIDKSDSGADGYLSSTDFNTFNGKQDTMSLTTTGTYGNATLVGSSLNIPTIPSLGPPKFSQSYSGWIDVSASGLYIKQINSSTPFKHTQDISANFRARDATKAADYICVIGDKFMGLKGTIAGTRGESLTVSVFLHKVVCGTAPASNKTLLGSQTLALDRDDTPQCYDISPSIQALLTGDCITVALDYSGSGTVEAFYTHTLYIDHA